MAVGDAAAAAGMSIVAGSVAANTIDTEINRSRDYIAERESVLDGISTASAARTALDVFSKANTVNTNGSYNIEMQWNGTSLIFFVNGSPVGSFTP